MATGSISSVLTKRRKEFSKQERKWRAVMRTSEKDNRVSTWGKYTVQGREQKPQALGGQRYDF